MKKTKINAPLAFAKLPKAKPFIQGAAVIYRGPSLLDGKPIIVVVNDSENSKTGGVKNTWILREDIAPMQANKNGEDYSICGNCRHRGTHTSHPDKKTAAGRTCYVTLYQAPTNVFKSYHNNRYLDIVGDNTAIAAMGAGQYIRIGSYGDGATVPQSVWDALLSQSKGHTAYSHQLDTVEVSKGFMVSADSQSEAQNAHSKGYRTFRVIPVAAWEIQGKEALMKNEVLCPASKEGGYKSTCIDCQLCNGVKDTASILEKAKQEKEKAIRLGLRGVIGAGTIEGLIRDMRAKEDEKAQSVGLKQKSIAIVAHGTGKNNVK